MRPVNLVIAGVGGQGVLLVAKVVAEAALDEGIESATSEVHGMSQRGGSVVSTVRLGGSSSPLIGRGDADAILALEPMETLRVIDFASPRTVVVCSTTAIPPMGVLLGKEEYPPLDAMLRRLRAVTRRVYAIEAERTADDLGAPVVANVILLGALLGTGVLPLRAEAIRKRLLAHVPPDMAKVNLEALEAGQRLTSNARVPSDL